LSEYSEDVLIEKLQREEIPEYPVAALREAITNAVMHRDWFIEGANVFVEVFTDRIEVSSPGGLPKGMLPEDLGSKSVRRNPLIADLLHRIAYIEKAGTGIRRMRDGARDQGYPEPEFSAGSFFSAVFRPIAPIAGHDEAHETLEPTEHVLHMYRTSDEHVAVLQAAMDPKTRDALQMVAGIRHRQHFYREYLHPLLEEGLLEPTIPDKPRSPKQRYRTTPAGRAVLEKREKEAGA
jgi:ATP-dependent DNA helicase RecG